MLESIALTLLGSTALLVVLPAIRPVQDLLKSDPEKPNKLALWTTIEPWQTKAKVRRQRFVGLIGGTEGPVFSLSPWELYDWYVWKYGLRLIGIPSLQELYLYDMTRLEMTDEVVTSNGHQVHVFTHETDTDKSDHIRTRPFTFHFKVSGAEVDTVPISIVGSIEAKFERGNTFDETAPEYRAFFGSDSWSVQLAQVIGSVIPKVVRSTVTLGDVIGEISKDLWEEQDRSDKRDEVMDQILQELLNYKFVDKEGDAENEVTLKELIALDIMTVNVTDFILDITDEEARAIRESVIGRQKGRGRDLAGQGEGRAQTHILNAVKSGGEHGKISLVSEAIVRATSEGGQLDALVAAFLAKVVGSDRVLKGE